MTYSNSLSHKFTYENTVLYASNLVLHTFSGAQLIIFRFQIQQAAYGNSE